MAPIIRAATIDDVVSISRIHDEQGIATTACYDWEPLGIDYWRHWFHGHSAAGLPCLVATDGAEILGYAYYSPFSPKAGWRFTMEHSIYLTAAAQGLGLGMRMMTALITIANQQGIHTLLGLVDTANGASVRLHEKLGFTLVGTLHEAGFKFDRWLDCDFWALRLAEGDVPAANQAG